VIVEQILVNVLQMFYLGYAFNKIKGINDKKTYILIFVSYILAGLLSNFCFNSIISAYISSSVIFSLSFAIYNKNKFQITNLLLILNIILFTSIITFIPLLIIGYGNTYLFLNFLIFISFIILLYKFNISRYYYKLISCWNRNKKEPKKIKSVTLRNTTLIITYFTITVINLFLNYFISNLYYSLL